VKNTFISAWEFNLPGGSRARLYVSILRPEPPDFKYTVCLIQPDIDLDSDDLARSIEREFGSAVTKDMPGRFKDKKSWFFRGRKVDRQLWKGNLFYAVPVERTRQTENSGLH
jgi:hypothetical protein